MANSNKNSSKQQQQQKQLNKQEYVIQIPDGGYGWVVLIASFFVSFILDGVMYSFGIILNGIRESTRESNEMANLLSSLNTGFLFCSGPIVSGLCNVFGCRVVVMGGGLVTALMYMLTVFGPNIWTMLVTYGFIGGISTGCTYIASLIVIAEYFDKKRGIATGITMAGSGVGSFILPPLLGYLIKKYDWKLTFSVCACIILQTVVCGALMRPLKPQPVDPADKAKQVELKNLSQNEDQDGNNNNTTTKTHHEEENAHRVVETFHGSVYSLNEFEPKFYERYTCLRLVVGILKEMSDFRLLRENFAFLLITLSNFFLFIGYFAPFLYITKIAEENGIEKEMASFLISVIGIVNIPARMIFGFVADKRYVTPINLNTFSVFVATIPLFLYFQLQKHLWSQLVFAILFAIGMAGMNCLTTMYLVDLVGLKRFGNATGIINLFRGFGCFIGPFAAGMIADRFEKIHCFFFSGICFSIGLGLTLLVSFGSSIKSCMNKGKEGETTMDAIKTGDESEINKNLLQKV